MTGPHAIRDPIAADIAALTSLWHDGWHEAHAPHVPDVLIRARTLDDFDRRLRATWQTTRVIGSPGDPLGFCALREDEVMHLFVSPRARGTGAATALLQDGEARLRQHGVHVAWLGCIIGNDRAARFYQRENWVRQTVVTYLAETAAGPVPLELWRHEKALRTVGAQAMLTV